MEESRVKANSIQTLSPEEFVKNFTPENQKLQLIGSKLLDLTAQEEELLAELSRVHIAVNEHVTEARSNGATWLQIGQLLGISRELAYHRHGKPKPDAGSRRRGRPPTKHSD